MCTYDRILLHYCIPHVFSKVCGEISPVQAIECCMCVSQPTLWRPLQFASTRIIVEVIVVDINNISIIIIPHSKGWIMHFYGHKFLLVGNACISCI